MVVVVVVVVVVEHNNRWMQQQREQQQQQEGQRALLFSSLLFSLFVPVVLHLVILSSSIAALGQVHLLSIQRRYCCLCMRDNGRASRGVQEGVSRVRRVE
jgi:hypothetical protein